MKIEKQISHLTRREYFAGFAMMGLLNAWGGSKESVASQAVSIADALIKELDETQETD